MKYTLFLALFLSVTVCANATPGDGNENSKGVTNQDTSKAGELIWAAEFDGSGAPSDEDWTYNTGHGNNGWGNREVQSYTTNPENVRIEDGKLIIQALKKDGKWTSARIKTQDRHTFKHVTVKVRAKLPKGAGTWPAIWLLGSNISEVGWPASGEIDIMEHTGKNPGIVHSALHTPSSHGNTKNAADLEVPDATDAFHVYETVWTADSITFKVDGNAFYTYNPEVKNDKTWPYNHKFFLIMNIAMGGYMGSDPQFETDGKKNGIDPELNQARMVVDYVRVYNNK